MEKIAAIQTRDIVKRYGDFYAVAGVDLAVSFGECFGLLGPNGAGKTTLVKMVTAVLPITSGEAIVAGMHTRQHPRQIKALIGMVPQEENLDPDFTILKNLMVFSRYFDIPSAEAKKRAMANLEFFELAGRRDAKIKELSGGMKRRLLIARALINQPRILVLDEPTVGLDPQTKHLVWQRLNSLKQKGKTLLLTTQNMEEAAVLCDRLAIMDEGRIVAQGTPQELISQYGGTRIIEARVSADRRTVLEAELKARDVFWQGIGDILYIFQSDGIEFSDEMKDKMVIVSQRMPTLEDVFLRITGRSLEQ